MCSNADAENEGAMLMERVEKLNLDEKWCRKCTGKTAANVVLRKKDAYCKECFLSSVTHKFRACLGKSRMMRPGDKVLVGFSGSDCSAALLHLIKSGLGDTSHKRLMVEPLVVFVDESEVLNATIEEQKQTKQNIKEALTEYNFPKHIVPLKMCFETENTLEAYLRSREDEQSADVDKPTILKQLFNNLSDVTSKVDMLNKLRHKLLVQVAKILGCGKVFTAESADDLAVKLFTNISLGRGAQLPFDVGFSDDRNSEVRVIRPLRDISKKELVFYTAFHGLQSVHVPSLTTKADTHSSIQKLTETFLCELQDGFPGTLSTVFRVADKLTNSAADAICLLCQAPLDTDDVISSSLNATNFSRCLSSLGSSKFDALTLETLTGIDTESNCCTEKTDPNDQNCCGGGTCSNDSLVTDLIELLCYGCKLILKNAHVTALPSAFVRHLQESNQRFKMKKEIQDFLL